MIAVEARGAVLWIRLDRPEARHALDLEAMEALAAAWRRLQDDDALWLGVVTATGGASFCAGADLRRLPAQLAERHRLGLPMPPTVFNEVTVDKPLVAAINGDALGGGLELALVCDLRIAAAHARLGCPEPRRGLMPAGGATQRLPRLIGRSAAAYLLFTGEPIGAAEALRLGLVQEVVDAADLERATAALCEKLLASGPLALRAIKRALAVADDSALADGLAAEAREALALLPTADAAEGLAAFREKRGPRWQAR